MRTLAQEFGFTQEQGHAVISKGFDLFEAGDLEGAAVIFEGMLALNPLDSGLFGALGTIRKMQGRNEEALMALNESISLHSKGPVARFHRGEMLLSMGKLSEAKSDFLVACEVESPLKSKALASLSAISA